VVSSLGNAHNRAPVRIQLYVLRQLLTAFVFAVSGLAVIILPTIAIQAVNRLGAPSMGTVVTYLPLVVSELVPYLLPMAFLLAVVATYGRLAAERELIAIKMAGIHPAKLAIPGFLVALPLVFGTDRLLSEISPDLKFHQRSLLMDAEVSRFQTYIKGRTTIPFGKNSLLAASNRDGVLSDVVLDMQDEDGKEVQISAAEARFDVQSGVGDDDGDLLLVHLTGARVLRENKSFNSGSVTIPWKIQDLWPKAVREHGKAKYMRTSDMNAELSSPTLAPNLRNDYVYELQRRHALSVTYLLFLLLGIPTGVVLRSSTQLGAFTGAVGYSFCYYILAMRLGKVLAATGAVAPLFAAWATNSLFLVVGLVLFVRALWR